MSLTKQQFFEKAKPTVEEIDVPDFGTVWVRSVPALTVARREVSARDSTTGGYADGQMELIEFYRLIDQVMMNETEPMFSEDDIDALSQVDDRMLAPYRYAVSTFNNEFGTADPNG